MRQKREAVQLALFIMAPFLLSLLFRSKATGLRFKLVWELTGTSSTICFRVNNILWKLFLSNFLETQILIRNSRTRWVAKGIQGNEGVKCSYTKVKIKSHLTGWLLNHDLRHCRGSPWGLKHLLHCMPAVPERLFITTVHNFMSLRNLS